MSYVKPEEIIIVSVAAWLRQVEVTVSLLTWITVKLWRMQHVHLKLISLLLIIFIVQNYNTYCVFLILNQLIKPIKSQKLFHFISLQFISEINEKETVGHVT